MRVVGVSLNHIERHGAVCERHCSGNSVKRITLCFDLDSLKDEPEKANYAARHDHIMKTIHAIKDVDPSFEVVYIATFSYPCDSDEFIHDQGPEAFLEFLKDAVPCWKYAYDYYSSVEQ